MNNILEEALRYTDIGWNVLPVQSPESGNGKIPLIKDWTNQATTDKSIICQWWDIYKNPNIGVLTGNKSNLIVLDIDKKNNGFDSLEELCGLKGNLPITCKSITGGGGIHLFFRDENNSIHSNAGLLGSGIDIRGEGGQIILPPSKHISGNAYYWEEGKSPFDISLASMPDWIIEKLKGPVNHKVVEISSMDMISEGMRNSTLFRCASALRAQGMNESLVFSFLSVMNQQKCRHPLPENEIHSISKSIVRYSPGEKFDDDDLADLYIESHYQTVFGMDEFKRYQTGIWECVPEREIKQEILSVLQNSKFNGIKPTSYKLQSVEEILKTKTYIQDDKWNSNNNILVLKNGTINLTNFEFREHRPEDYSTISLPFGYNPTSTALTWNKFINSVFPQGISLFLQEFAGYCLTPETKHEATIWLYGPPASGKSTFITGMRAMLGDKAGVLGLDDIENSRFGLDGIFGKTLLVCEEQPSIKITKSHVINKIISGEYIKADRKFREPIEFKPCAKLLWAMNELPKVASSKNGLFRRVKIVELEPLDIEPDWRIKKQIEGEGQGIFNWALEGLKRLHERNSFEYPPKLLDMKSKFIAQSCSSERFIKEKCEWSTGERIQSEHLYQIYLEWCIEREINPDSQKGFSMKLSESGFHKMESNGRRYWIDISIK